MDKLSILDITDTPNLVSFKTDGLPSLHEAMVTYPAHCCALNSDYGFGTIFKETAEEDLVPCDPNETPEPETEIFELPEEGMTSELPLYEWHRYSTGNGKSCALF